MPTSCISECVSSMNLDCITITNLHVTAECKRDLELFQLFLNFCSLGCMLDGMFADAH
jgi:hypothetical protein